MPFEPGNSGNPKGQMRAKEFAQNLRIAVSEAFEKGGTKLRALADKLVEEGLEGNVHAIKEVADRLDGRVPQAISIDQEERVKFIAVVPSKPASTEEWLRLIEKENPNAPHDVIEGHAREIDVLPDREHE
jgi:hypothetical protein